MHSVNVTIGSFEAQGLRHTMEDVHVYFKKEKYGKRIYCAALFDGHGGRDVVDYLEPFFCTRLYDCLDLNDVPKSLTTLFQQLDDEMNNQDLKAGSTAVVVIIVDNVLYSANIGDSEACIVKEINDTLNTVDLVYRHTARDKTEIDRVNSVGGSIWYGRVEGTLAISRAFGDFYLKMPYKLCDIVSSEPYISTHQLDEHCKYVIIACDGLWDVCTHDEAAKLVNQWVKDGKTIDETSQLLVEYALSEGSSDNVTVQLINLDWINLDTNTDTVFPIYTIPESRLFLKSLKNVNVSRSYFYLSEEHKDFCVRKLGKHFPLPGWVSQELISFDLFGQEGVNHLKSVEKYYNCFIHWAPQFSNVRSTFNFFEPSIIIDNVSYNGPEQYFQLMKSFGTSDHEHAKAAMSSANPDQAYFIGRTYKMRSDWNKPTNINVIIDRVEPMLCKDLVMFEAIKAKFSQYPSLTELLLDTVGKKLVQLKPNDDYWGTGYNGEGKNMLGRLLMQVRELL